MGEPTRRGSGNIPELRYAGRLLDTGPGAFAELRRSDGTRAQSAELRVRLETDGYLFVPGLLRIDEVLAARDSVLQRLEAEGALDPAYPRLAAVAKPGVKMAFRAELATGNPEVEHLLYAGPMIAFFEDLLGGPVLHFDYTWLRAKSPGADTMTHPHCDIVYMSRGTPYLFTAWTPLGDVPYEHGGLLILEGSHRRADRLGEYWQMDVDTYCANRAEAPAIEAGRQTWEQAKQGGAFHKDAIALQAELGGRWLSAAFSAGDVVVFGMHTLHGSSDNQSNRIRLSTDSRYQLASEPADERWIGSNPIAHGAAGKRGKIC